MVRSRSSRIPLSSVAAPPAAPSPPPAVIALPTATPAETRTPPSVQPPAVTAAGAPSLATDIDALFEQLQAEAAAFAGDDDAGTLPGQHASVVSERVLLTLERMDRMTPAASPGADGATGAVERPETATPDRPLRRTPQGAAPLPRVLSMSASTSNVPVQLARDRAESDAVSDVGAAPGLAQRARSAVPVVPPQDTVDSAPEAPAALAEPAPAHATSAAAAAIARDPLVKQLLQQIDELMVTRAPALRAQVRAQALSPDVLHCIR